MRSRYHRAEGRLSAMTGSDPIRSLPRLWLVMMVEDGQMTIQTMMTVMLMMLMEGIDLRRLNRHRPR